MSRRSEAEAAYRAKQQESEARSKRRLWLPGDPEELKKKLIIPAKRLFVREKDGDLEKQVSASDELEIATPFNRQQRRFHQRIGRRLERRAKRKQARKEIRFQAQFFEVAGQRFEVGEGCIVRRDSEGKELPAITRPPILKIRLRQGYLEAHGPEKLERSQRQQKIEAKRSGPNKNERAFLRWPRRKFGKAA